MLFRMLAASVAAALLFLAAPASAAGVPIVKKTITFKTKEVDISVAYPQTGNKAVDAVLLAYARKRTDDFKRDIHGTPSMPGMSMYLEIGYTVERNDAQVLGIVFAENTFMGGAHPNNDSATFNFLMPSGAQVFLGEILDGKNGVDRVSRLIVAKLVKDLGTGEYSMSDKDWIGRGAGPNADNFKRFIILPSKLHIYFPPYQVAAYAAGPQEVTFDLQALKDVIRADWRAPAPSFDCRKAKTGIEKAVCADAALARLDRQMAEAYQTSFDNTDYDKAVQGKLRNEQRDWLAKTLKACNVAAPGPCLTKAYTARIATLRAAP